MSGNKNHIHHFEASDIEKYLKGELSAAQMHAIERAALDDPFLADALEGIALHHSLPGQPALSDDLDSLRARLEKKITPEKTPLKHLRKRPVAAIWRAAAAVIILAAVAITARYALFKKDKAPAALAQKSRFANADPAQTNLAAAENSAAPPTATNNLATATSQVQTSSPVKAKSPAPASAPDTARTAAAAKKAPEPASQLIAEPAALSSPDSTAIAANRMTMPVPTNRPAALSSGQPAAASHYSIVNNGPGIANTAPIIFNKAPGIAQHLELSPSADTRLYKITAPDKLVWTGRVTDANSNALPGTAIYVKSAFYDNNNISTVTDKDGYFTMRLKKMDSSGRLVIAHTGYDLSYVSLNLNDNNRPSGNIIQLHPQSLTLNEVVVSGYGAKRKETLRRNIDAEVKTSSLIAIPADGWLAYNRYIDANKKTPALDTTLIGNESISFIVNKSGKLSSFKVEQSISPAHDSSAIQLIRNGPSWKLTKGHSARAVVTVTFP